MTGRSEASSLHQEGSSSVLSSPLTLTLRGPWATSVCGKGCADGSEVGKSGGFAGGAAGPRGKQVIHVIFFNILLRQFQQVA